jgi:hypothetical protein
LAGFPGDWNRLAWYFHGRDFAPSFVSDDLEFAHVVFDHHLDVGSLLVDHWNHDNAGQQRHDADSRSRNGGYVS